MQITNYQQAINYLESFIGKVIFKVDPEYLKHHDPLERMRVLLSLLDNPQNKFPSILVGGTSGKGSTAYLISHIFKTAGYKTGLTISPHLQKVNERLQINGEAISNASFAGMVSSIIRIIEEMKGMRVGAPSYFEIIIAMAFKYFVDQKVDIAVVEVGMGGEFDSTNTLYPLVAVLTNVSLDHTNVLGKTVEKIARTKVGIFKNARGPVSLYPHPMSSLTSFAAGTRWGSPSLATPRLVVVTGIKQKSVIKIVENRCKKVGAELFRLGRDFSFRIRRESLEGSVFDLTTHSDRIRQLNNLRVSLLGDYQVENAILAIETVLQLEKFGFEVSEDQIRKALKTAFFPGRFEILSVARGPVSLYPRPMSSLTSFAAGTRWGSPSLATPRFEYTNYTLILDGAHNPTKMKAFLSALKKLYPKEKKIFLIAFKFDKDIPRMLKQITKVADKIIVTEFHAKTDMAISASADALNIKSQISNLKSGGNVVVEKDSKKALQKALKILTIEQSNNRTIIVVTGSLYLVGEIRSML